MWGKYFKQQLNMEPRQAEGLLEVAPSMPIRHEMADLPTNQEIREVIQSFLVWKSSRTE